MNISNTTIRIALAGLVLATSASVAALTTESFVLDSADAFFEGEIEGTAVHSDGSVRAGAATKRTELENVPLAYSVVQRGSTTFIGTGTNGVVYRFDGKSVKAFANAGELLVASLAFGPLLFSAPTPARAAEDGSAAEAEQAEASEKKGDEEQGKKE